MKQIKNISSYIRVGNEDPIKTEYNEYDQNGNLILSEKYDEGGTLIEKSEFTYNDNNLKTEEKQYLSETELAEEHFFIYTEEGQLSEIKKRFAEGYESRRTIELDSVSKNRTELELDEDGEIEEKHVWIYSNGNLREQAEYDDRDKLVRKTQYDFDDNNRLIEEREYEKKDKKPTQVKQYTYQNEEEKIHGLKVLNRKGKIINQYQLQYDEQGRVVKQISPISGSIEVEHISELERMERSIDANGNIRQETKFLYDDQKNLIKEETPLQITEHKIEYYSE